MLNCLFSYSTVSWLSLYMAGLPTKYEHFVIYSYIHGFLHSAFYLNMLTIVLLKSSGKYECLF